MASLAMDRALDRYNAARKKGDAVEVAESWAELCRLGAYEMQYRVK